MSNEQLETPDAYVAQLFLSFFGRAAEYEALRYYVNRLSILQEENGLSFQDAYKALATEIYLTGQLNGEQPSGEAYSHRAYVSDLYANVLGRDAANDMSGWDYWTGTLERGGNSVESLLAVFLASARYSDRDSDYLANRTLVALEFAHEENSGPQVLSTLEFDAKMILDGVNEDPSTVVLAQSRFISASTPDASIETLTLLDALAAETLPTQYALDPSEGFAALPMSLADTLSSLDVVNTLIKGATNADDLSLTQLYRWSIDDTVDALIAGIDDNSAELALNGAQAIRVTDDQITQEQFDALQVFSNFVIGDTTVIDSGGDTTPNIPTLVFQTENWTAGSNTFSMTLEYPSDLIFDKLGMDGTYSLSSTQGSTTLNGVTTLTLRGQISNGQESGAIKLTFAAVPSLEGKTVLIKQIDINGNKLQNATYPLDDPEFVLDLETAANPVKTLTLQQAIAAEALPTQYSIDTSQDLVAESMSLADAKSSLAAVNAILNDATNAADLSLEQLYYWSIIDDADIISAGLNDSSAELTLKGAQVIRVINDSITQDQLNALQILPNFDLGDTTVIEEEETPPIVPILLVQANNWIVNSNTFDITLEYQSDLVFDKVGMDGSYTLSSTLSSTTENGFTSLTLKGQISNGQENGILKLMFKPVSTPLAGREVLIKQLDINGVQLQNEIYPLDDPDFVLEVEVAVEAVEKLTLREALAKEIFPTEYAIDASQDLVVEPMSLADAKSSLAAVNAILNDATNAADLSLEQLYYWSINDDADIISAGLNDSSAELTLKGAQVIRVINDSITQDQLNALQVLPNFDLGDTTVIEEEEALPIVPILLVQANNWIVNSNTFDITLEYQSDLVFDKMRMDGSYTLSSTLSSTTENGFTSLTLKGQISNGQENGVLKLMFKPVSTPLAGREVLIKQLDINGAKLQNVPYPLDSSDFALEVGNDPQVVAQSLTFAQENTTADTPDGTSIDPDLADDFVTSEFFFTDQDEPHFGSYDDGDNPRAGANLVDNLPLEETPSSLGGDLDDFI